MGWTCWLWMQSSCWIAAAVVVAVDRRRRRRDVRSLIQVGW